MSEFARGAYVRKKSGAFWEGVVVGHYSTEQTPDGVAVQLFGWPNGPVQIYPAAALEPCQLSGIEGERRAGFRANIAPENHDALDGDWQKAASGTGYMGFAVEDIVWRGRRATIVDRDFPLGTPVTSAMRCTPPPSTHLRGQNFETPTPPGNQIRTAECDGKDAVPVTGQLPVGTASPQSLVAGCQDISTAPANTDVLVWWPTVKLDDYGDPTEEVVGGCWLISEESGGYWVEPDCMNAIGDHMGDDHTYADKPSHWMPLPSALFTATTEGRS